VRGGIEKGVRGGVEINIFSQVEGYDFFKPEERAEFFMKWARVKKYLLSGKAFIGPKIVRLPLLFLSPTPLAPSFLHLLFLLPYLCL
jgi:hypothetical protein